MECTDLDKLTQDEFYQLHRTYNTLCLGLRCDEEAAKACQTQAPVGTETNMLCWYGTVIRVGPRGASRRHWEQIQG